MSPRGQAAPSRAAEAGHAAGAGRDVEDAPAGEPASGGAAKGQLPTRTPARRPSGKALRSRGRPRAGRRAEHADPAAHAPGRAAVAESGSGAESRPATAGNAAAAQTPALSARLMALARMIQIGAARSGRDGFSKKLLRQAEDVLGRAGERMRLSSAHTVVVLAGGTGSGKSSLFNCLAGAEFSTVGVTRPVTTDAHACIWDDAGSGALLEWLGVPQRNRYSRASALGGGESGLAGLVLLDLPDHDSVMGHATGQVDRLVSLADVMIWVLDPQKYADAAVHQRFLIPLAGHSEVQAVLLNQSDLLTSAQVEDCVGDLRRLLDAENLHDVPILATSAVTGAGLDELRGLLAKGVAARQASAARIAADVDTVVTRFAPYAGEAAPAADAGEAPGVPDGCVDALAGQFYAAAGVSAVSDSLCSATELRAADFVGWPVAWFVQRLTGRDPLRKERLGRLWSDLRSVSSGPAGAQQAAIDNALSEFGDRVAGSLPKPWGQTVKAAARSRADAIPAAIGEAIGGVLPDQDSVVTWWRGVGVLQGVLLGAVAVAAAWFVAALMFGVLRVASGAPGVIAGPLDLLWAALLAGAALGLGVGAASLSMSRVKADARAEQVAVAERVRTRIGDIVQDMAVMPVRQELSELDRYRRAFAAASGIHS